jgi:glucose-6-phosphate isomerase
MMNWADLQRLHDVNKGRHILDLFDESRAQDFSVTADGMLFDYSKTNIDAATRAALVKLAESSGVAEKRAAMFSGERINDTEGRAVLHVALRAGDEAVIKVDGKDVLPEVRRIRAACAGFARDVRSGAFKGQGGRITDVVNIGIGGSDLGPAMAYLALAPFADGPRCHFVSNVDGAHIHDVLKDLNPETTLVIVASKTFTTIETMTNADTAKRWMGQRVANPATQFAAVSTAGDKTAAYGIDPERVFGFEDWVGGRYSMWGPIGLSLMIAIGPERFDEFLAGGRAMDQHFHDRALRGQHAGDCWRWWAYGTTSSAASRLGRSCPMTSGLPDFPHTCSSWRWRATASASPSTGRTSTPTPAPWSGASLGTNGQHAFYQLIHQGPGSFLASSSWPARGMNRTSRTSTCFLCRTAWRRPRRCCGAAAWTKRGRSWPKKGLTGAELERQARHRVFPGNRPSTVLAYDRLTPFRPWPDHRALRTPGLRRGRDPGDQFL